MNKMALRIKIYQGDDLLADIDRYVDEEKAEQPKELERKAHKAAKNWAERNNKDLDALQVVSALWPEVYGPDGWPIEEAK